MSNQCSICFRKGHNARTCSVKRPAPVSGENNPFREETNATDGQSGSDLDLTLSLGLTRQVNTGIWSADEHTRFLNGVRAIGTRSWKALSDEYVWTRTPHQVANHYQKRPKRDLTRNPSSISDLRSPVLVRRPLTPPPSSPPARQEDFPSDLDGPSTSSRQSDGNSG